VCFISIVEQKASYAQNKEAPACIVVSDNRTIKSPGPIGILLENNTGKDIRWLFEFGSNGYYNEETLKEKILKGVDPLKSKTYNQLLILDNIASIIKSPNHRNLNLLFSSASPSVSNKKYSPMAMITSFYDKQCNDYQRLAAQMAILTPYFQWQDFKAYYIFRHTIVDIKIGNHYIFHDFDPGEPGFRFYKNADSSVYASFTDLMSNVNLIREEQFYTYNGTNLCPWISESYYRSLFSKLNGQYDYTNLDKVFGFIPQWVIPTHTKISTYFPDTTIAGRFGTKVRLNKKDSLVNNAFKSYSKYRIHKNANDSLETNLNITRYLKKNFDFDINLNYLYLIQAGLIEFSDSTNNITTFNNKHLTVSVTTNNDTLFFLKDFLIPLPLRKVSVKEGKVAINETEGIKNLQYIITDSLVFNLFDYSPPVITSSNIRKAPTLDASSLIYGPSQGYIAPHSTVEFEYYYNPFYYAFHDLVFTMRYEQGCEGRLEVKPIYK